MTQEVLGTSRIAHHCLNQWIHVSMFGIKHRVESFKLTAEELAQN
jgi:hypothetical protein